MPENLRVGDNLEASAIDRVVAGFALLVVRQKEILAEIREHTPGMAAAEPQGLIPAGVQTAYRRHNPVGFRFHIGIGIAHRCHRH